MQGQIYPNCFGPYLRYAISTRFEYFSSFDQTISVEHRILFDEDTFKLFLLVEFKNAGQADEFADKMNKILAQPSVDLGPANDQSRFSTMRTLTTAVTPADSD